MNINKYLFIALIFASTNIVSFYGGSDYTPSYQGRAGAGYITPSRFAPLGYSNGGWDSKDENSCNQNCREYKPRTTNVKKYPDVRPIIRQR